MEKAKSCWTDIIRTRRNRQSSWVRELVAETCITSQDLILPIFICEGTGIKEPIENMPDVYVMSTDAVLEHVQLAYDCGIQAVALFPNVESDKRSHLASEAYNKNNLVCRTIRLIQKKVPNIGVIGDIALDAYTTHGHDGIVDEQQKDVINDVTVEALVKQALVFAEAGCQFMGLSDMMDGRVKNIRRGLDACGFTNVGLISYAVKYASSFYGPFRSATGSANYLKTKDKKTYQMDPRNVREAHREIKIDVEEGADILLIKPGMLYLDIIKHAREHYDLPIFAYQVSGEYAMLKQASIKGFLDWERAIMESLICLKRAGSTAILSYAALDVAKNILK